MKLVYFFLVTLLASEHVSAQSEVDFSKSYSRNDILAIFPQNRAIQKNEEMLVGFLAGVKATNFRVAISTETENSRSENARQIAKYGKLLNSFPIHTQIAFGANTFLVQDISYPSDRYSLDKWEQIPAHFVLRSDLFSEGRFTSLRSKGDMLFGDFGSLEDFKKACIDELRRPLRDVFTGNNFVMHRAVLSFRKYTLVQNLGHEGIIPLSYEFDDAQRFTCQNFQGERIAGRYIANPAGIIEQMIYGAAGKNAQRIILFFYTSMNSNSWWFPSHVLDVVANGDKYKVRTIHTIHGIREFESEPYVPNTTASLYGTNIKAEFTWSNQMMFKKVAGVLVEQEQLTRMGDVRSEAKRYYILLILCFASLALVFIYFIKRVFTSS